MAQPKYDFSGWVTVNDLECADGRTIRHNAFAENDGMEVPLVWNHQHDSISNVLGKCLLKNKDRGVYGYGSFNDSPAGQDAKEALRHGDIVSLSIYANQLKQRGGDVLHGKIREVSLVLAGANPGALIENVTLAHGENFPEDEAVIYTGMPLSLYHADTEEDEKKPSEDEGEKKVATEEKKEAGGNDKTVKEVFDSFTEEQKQVVYYMIGAALEDQGGADDDEGEEEVKHNVFEGRNDNTLAHV